MKPSVCFYFQVHQPYRLKDLRITDVGSMGPGAYFDQEKNRAIFRKVAEKCYLPANAVLLKLLQSHKDMRIAFSLSGVFLDQCREYGEDVLASFQALAATGKVEFLAETYYHSLSALYSIDEFCEQVDRHVDAIETLFGVRPRIFRNTELVYSNEIAEVVRLLGFRGILAEGADHLLAGRTPNVLYRPPHFRLPRDWERTIARHRIHQRRALSIRTLLKNFRLSDDIAFRFSNRQWPGYPLTADTFADWVSSAGGDTVNLFMDYETFGEHQWADTGIFEFLSALPSEFSKRGIRMLSPSQVITRFGRKHAPALDAHAVVSWADTERDLSAWRANSMQEAALSGIYALEGAVRAAKSPALLETWRRLQTSDHFYYLSTKYWSDGDVHKYFSPYDSPYEAFRRYSHALHDLRLALEKITHKELRIMNQELGMQPMNPPMY
jgi:alpha-amylase